MLRAERELNEEGIKKVIELKAKGMPIHTIKDEINNQFGTDIASEDLKNLLAKNEKIAFNVARAKGNLEGEIAKRYFDAVGQINDLNAEMWNLYYDLKEKDESREMVKVADHIFKHIEHVDKIIGRLKNASLNITINKVDLSKKIAIVVPEMLEKLERKGAIKIKSRRMVNDIVAY